MSASPRWVSPPAAKPAISSRVPLWQSLRARTAAAFSLFTIALILISGALFANASLAGARDQLRDEAAGQLRLALAGRALGGPLPANASLNPAVLPARAARALDDKSIVTFDDGRFMWAAERIEPVGVLSIKLSNAPVDRQWAELRSTFVIAGIGSAVASIVIGWLIAGSLTRRLRRVAGSINQAVDGEMGALPEGRDEVAVISRGIARSAENLRLRLDRERAFAADVAHDLKTPLTALVSASSLLDESPDSQRVRHQIRRMQTLVEDLLELGRAEAGIDAVAVETVHLPTLVRDIVDASPEAHDCTVVAEHDDYASVDSRRLSRVLVNLLANAARHGHPPIEIAVTRSTITVQDHGTGFPDDILRSGPQRFARRGASGGAGLGLAIAVQHATAMGLELTLRNAEHGGAVVEIGLAAEPGA